MARGLKPEDAFNKALYYTEGPGRGQNWISALVEQEREAQPFAAMLGQPVPSGVPMTRATGHGPVTGGVDPTDRDVNPGSNLDPLFLGLGVVCWHRSRARAD